MYTTVSQPYFFASSGKYRAVSWFINDKPRTQNPQKILQQYIVDARIVFVKKTEALSNFKESFTDKDEKQLSAMLELLIDARKIWEEES